MEPIKTYVFPLLVNAAYLRPDVGASKGPWRISKNAIEGIQGIIVFTLLLTGGAETKRDLDSPVKVQFENQEDNE